MAPDAPGHAPPLEVNLLGQRLVLKGTCDGEHVQALARLVGEKIDAARGSGTLSAVKLALLAALNIADELILVRGREQAFRCDVAARSQALLAQLDDLEITPRAELHP